MIELLCYYLDEVSVENLSKFVPTFTLPVVGHTVLWEIIGADFFLPSCSSNLLPPQFINFGFLLLLHHLKETALEDFFGFDFVLLL